MDSFGVSKRATIIALTILSAIYFIRFAFTTHDRTQVSEHVNLAVNTYGKIQNKVAVITDTQYTQRLIPLILHFHSVLSPDWPIIFYTSKEVHQKHFSPDSKGSAILNRAVADKRIEIRTAPSYIDLTQRHDVNLYLTRAWLWEQLAPAQHVLIFQADSMICANAHRTVDDYLQNDFVGAPLSRDSQPKKFKGGLSLRNRTMILDILSEGNSWEEETKAETFTHGEDAWFSLKMEARGANLPNRSESLQFACQGDEHLDTYKEPLGFHKVHVKIPNRIPEIMEWCPEIALAAPGTLGWGDES